MKAGSGSRQKAKFEKREAEHLGSQLIEYEILNQISEALGDKLDHVVSQLREHGGAVLFSADTPAGSKFNRIRFIINDLTGLVRLF